MSVRTDIVSNHKVIVDPNGFEEIDDVLNIGTRPIYISTLCSSSKINRWAKYKPVKFANLIDSTGQLNNDMTWKDSANWWRSDNANSYNCGIDVSYQTSFLTMCRNWLNNGWEVFWSYSPPTGGTSAPFRLADFNYYCHKNTINPDYDKPYHTWSCGGLPDETEHEVYVYPDDYGDLDGNCLTSVQGICYRNSHTNKYLLTIANIGIKYQGSQVDMGQTYFGVVIGKDITTNNAQFSLNTCPFTWDENVPSNHEWHPAGTDMRLTPQLHYSAFSGQGEYYAFPVCVYTTHQGGHSQWTDPINKMSTTNTDLGTGEYMIPLPLAPKKLTLERVQLVFSISVSVSDSEILENKVTYSITVTNVSGSGAYLNHRLLLCDHTSYPKTTSGETDYSDPLEQPMLQVEPSGSTSDYLGVGMSVTISFEVTPRNSYSRGYYDMVKIYGNGSMGHGYATASY